MLRLVTISTGLADWTTQTELWGAHLVPYHIHHTGEVLAYDGHWYGYPKGSGCWSCHSILCHFPSVHWCGQFVKVKPWCEPTIDDQMMAPCLMNWSICRGSDWRVYWVIDDTIFTQHWRWKFFQRVESWRCDKSVEETEKNGLVLQYANGTNCVTWASNVQSVDTVQVGSAHGCSLWQFWGCREWPSWSLQ